MRQLSDRYKELSEKSGRYPLLKIEIYAGTRLNWTDTIIRTISGADAIKSASYTSGTTIKPSKFETGTAFCAKFTAVLSAELYPLINNAQKIKVYTGFKDFENDTEEYVALGVFYVESKELRGEGVYISARDIMMYAERAWFPYKIEYPCSLTDVYREVVRQMGGKVDESYTLPVDAVVLEKPYTPSDPNVIYVHGETVLDGKPYTCRQMLGQIAKIQLGNAYVDGDGYVKFYSYNSASDVSDKTITDIRIEDERYSNLGVFYAYGDRTQEQVKSEETYGTIVFFTTLPIEDLNGEYYENFQAQAQKVCGWWWSGGQLTRKGQGNIEPGDKIEYTGKYGEDTFFISGIVMEWGNGSFDETLYSFAPTYEDSAFSSNNTDSAPSEVESEASSSEGGGSVTIEKAVIIQEANAKYLLHEYTQTEYIAGNKIGYGGPSNPIILQGLTCYANGVSAPNGIKVDEYSGKTVDNFPNIPVYGSMLFQEMGILKSSPNYYCAGFHVELEELGTTYNKYRLGFKTATEDGGVSTTNWGQTFTVYNNECGVTFVWNKIYPPGTYETSTLSKYFPYGYAVGRIFYKRRTSSTNETYSSEIGENDCALPFASEAEYNAAVMLTNESLSLIQVNETTTEV